MPSQATATQERQSTSSPQITREFGTGGTATLVDNRLQSVLQRRLRESRAAAESEPRTPQGSARFRQIAMAMGDSYGVDTSGLKATHNSSFPGSLNAEATIQGNNIHFAPGKDTDYNMRHEVAHSIDNALHGTPKGDAIVQGQRVDTTREGVVDTMARQPVLQQQTKGWSETQLRKNERGYPTATYGTSSNTIQLRGTEEQHRKAIQRIMGIFKGGRQGLPEPYVTGGARERAFYLFDINGAPTQDTNLAHYYIDATNPARQELWSKGTEHTAYGVANTKDGVNAPKSYPIPQSTYLIYDWVPSAQLFGSGGRASPAARAYEIIQNWPTAYPSKRQKDWKKWVEALVVHIDSLIAVGYHHDDLQFLVNPEGIVTLIDLDSPPQYRPSEPQDPRLVQLRDYLRLVLAANTLKKAQKVTIPEQE